MAKNIDYKIKVGVIGDAQLQRFQRSVDKINRSARASTTQMKRLGDGMQRMGAFARRAAFALAGMFSIQQTRTAIAFADAIGVTADKLGISTDALQEYRFAAEQTGVAQQAFDVGFQRFTRRTAEAARGTGVLAKEFESLGIALRNTDGSLRGNEELFRDYADAIQNTGSSSEQLRLAFAAFDTEGAGLVNLLRDGSDGLDRFSTAAQDAGVIMSQQVIRDAERLTDAFGKISLQLKANLYPVLIGLADVLINAASNIKQFINDVRDLDPVAVAVAAAFGGIALVITSSLVPAFVSLTTAVRAFMLSNPFTAIALAATTAVVLIITNWNKVTQFFQYKVPIALNKMVAAWYGGMYDILAATEGLVEGVVEKMDVVANALLAPINLLREWQGQAPITADVTSRAMAGMGNAMERMNQNAINASLRVFDLEDALAAAQETTVEVTTTTDGLTEGLDNLSTATDTAAGATRGLTQAAEENKTAMENAAESLKSSMGSAIEDGIINAAKGGKDAFKKMAESILEDIARMLIQIRIIRPLMNALFPEGGGGLGGLLGVARGGYFPQGIAGKPLTAYASGGIIGGRTVIGSNLIGENGPEAVVPLRRHNGRMGVAASPVNINVVNNAGSEVQVSESTGNDGQRTIDIMIEQKVKNAFATGGMDKIMQSRFGSRPVGG